MKMDKGSPFVVFMGIGFEIVALIILAAWLGGWIDQKLGVQGLATVGLILFVTVGWMIHVFFLLKHLNQRQSGPP